MSKLGGEIIKEEKKEEAVMKKIIVVNSKEGSVKVKNDVDPTEAASLTKVAEGLYRDIKYLFDDS